LFEITLKVIDWYIWCP